MSKGCFLTIPPGVGCAWLADFRRPSPPWRGALPTWRLILGDTLGESVSEFTGERLVPEASDPDLRSEHVARYCFAELLASGRRVLDAGCGVGYGSAGLELAGGTVFALDSAGGAVRRGQARHSGVRFVQGDCTALPFADRSLDLVVSFEVIEHIASWAELIVEAARVLAPPGLFLVSTPNRSYYGVSREEANPFHVHEFDYEEFHGALRQAFPHTVVFCENHVPAISITSGNTRFGRARFEASEADPRSAHFFLGACSKAPLQLPEGFTYVPETGNVLRERELHVSKLEEWIGTLEASHAVVQGRMSRELARLPYRILRRLGLAPRLPVNWSE